MFNFRGFKWGKKSDLLPLDNAKAQVDFLTKDLEYAENYKKFLEGFGNRKFPSWQFMYRIACRDVIDGKIALERAKAKLIESEKLETIFS